MCTSEASVFKGIIRTMVFNGTMFPFLLLVIDAVATQIIQHQSHVVAQYNIPVQGNTSFYQATNPYNLMTMCALDAPSQVIPTAGRHGLCLKACASNSSCISYNYYWNTSRCDLFDFAPTYYTYNQVCINYLVQPLDIAQRMCGNGSDIALRMPTVQSSGYQGNQCPSGLAVNGNIDTNWYDGSCSTTSGNEANPWWSVDLGSKKQIQSVIIYNRADADSYCLHDFHVGLTGTSPAVVTPNLTNYQTCSYFVGAAPGGAISLTCVAVGRYLIIQISSTALDMLTLCEVIVYCKPIQIV